MRDEYIAQPQTSQGLLVDSPFSPGSVHHHTPSSPANATESVQTRTGSVNNS